MYKLRYLYASIVLALCVSVAAPSASAQNLGGLTDYLFFFADGRQDANWQAASKGYSGDVAVNGNVANERTSGDLAFAGTIVTNASSLGAFQEIVDDNPGQAAASVNQGALIDGLLDDLVTSIQTINGLSVTPGYASVSSTSLDGLNTQGNGCETFVINVTSGFGISSQINIAGDACDTFILRWDTDANFSDGYEGQVKFQSGGAIVPGGELTPANFIHVAGDINASGGGSTPPPPYPQGPDADGASTFSGGGFFTGYWLTTGKPSMAYGSTGLRHGESASMSNAIFVGGWYTLATKFSLTSGTSGVGPTPSSPPPPPPGADCVECGFGEDDANKVAELTLRYEGPGGHVRIYNDDKVESNNLLFSGTLATGEQVTIKSSDIGEDSFSSKVGFYVDGTSDSNKVAEIHTSCSSPVGFGTTEQNQDKGEDPNGVVDFTIVSGFDKDGNELCDPPPPPPPGADCVECGFGEDDADGVSQLTLEYSGTAGTVRIYNNDDVKAENLLFEGFLSPGDEVTIMASSIGEDKFSSKVGFYVDGTSDSNKVAEIHTSCSSPVGLGINEQNQEKGEDPNGVVDFTIVSGFDKDGNELCDPPPPPPPGADCVECGFGEDDADGVSQLTLTYSGMAGIVQIYNDDKQENDELLFEGFLSPNDEVTIMASSIGKDKFSSKVGFYVGGQKVAEIHTSCSSPVGLGINEQNQEKGEDPNGVVDFTIVSGFDKDGNELCDPPPPPPPGTDCVECGTGEDNADKLSVLTLRYLGPDGMVTIYNDDKVESDELLFQGTLATGDEVTIMASSIGEDKFSSKVGFYVGGQKVAEIHTSCSSPVIPGVTTEANQEKGEDPNGVADFLVIGGRDKDGNPLIGSPPPEVSYSVSEAGGSFFVDILVTDDTGITSIDFEEVPVGDPNLELVEENFIPGAPMASLRFRIIDPTRNTAIRGQATDACGANACDDDAPPMFAPPFLVSVDNEDEVDSQGNVTIPATNVAVPFPVDRSVYPASVYFFDRLGLQLDVSDAEGVEFYQTFAIDNTFTFQQPDPSCADPAAGCVLDPAVGAFSFVQATVDISRGGIFGLLAADACNAAVFDPGVESGSGQRGVAGSERATTTPPSDGNDRTTAALDASASSSSEGPVEFALEANYPNPFAGRTEIAFSLPEAGSARMVVYDVLGRVVQVVADGEFAAGRHAVAFDGRGLASGTYFYRLESDQGAAIRQMTITN